MTTRTVEGVVRPAAPLVVTSSVELSSVELSVEGVIGGVVGGGVAIQEGTLIYKRERTN